MTANTSGLVTVVTRARFLLLGRLSSPRKMTFELVAVDPD